MTGQPRDASGRYLSRWIVERNGEARVICYLDPAMPDDPAPPEWTWLLTEARRLRWRMIGLGAVAGVVVAVLGRG